MAKLAKYKCYCCWCAQLIFISTQLTATDINGSFVFDIKMPFCNLQRRWSCLYIYQQQYHKIAKNILWGIGSYYEKSFRLSLCKVKEPLFDKCHKTLLCLCNIVSVFEYLPQYKHIVHSLLIPSLSQRMSMEW